MFTSSHQTAHARAKAQSHAQLEGTQEAHPAQPDQKLQCVTAGTAQAPLEQRSTGTNQPSSSLVRCLTTLVVNNHSLDPTSPTLTISPVGRYLCGGLRSQEGRKDGLRRSVAERRSGTLTPHTGVRARTGRQPRGQQRRARRTPPGTSNARTPRAARGTKGSEARGPRRGREAASGSPSRPPPASPGPGPAAPPESSGPVRGRRGRAGTHRCAAAAALPAP